MHGDIDEGSGPIVIFLHGEPSWSFLYRHMIKLCVAAAALAPDHRVWPLGQADGPRDVHVCASHSWIGQWFDAVVPPSAASCSSSKTGASSVKAGRVDAGAVRRRGRRQYWLAKRRAGAARPSKWLKFSQTVEVLPVGMIVSGGTADGLSEEAVDAYDAPLQRGGKGRRSPVPAGCADGALAARRRRKSRLLEIVSATSTSRS